MRILLPIDGSEPVTQTMKWVSEIFPSDQTQYHLLYVCRIVPDMLWNAVEFDMDEFLQKAKVQLQRNGCQVEKIEYLFGDPAHQICEYAENYPVDLVVIGSHGESGIAKILLGSTSSTILEHCKKPVIVYRNLLSLQSNTLTSVTLGKDAI